jgi:hypothetical protein
MEKATVSITCAGSFWLVSVVTGSISHVPKSTFAKTGEKLVQVCNQYGLKVINKGALAPELAKKLLLK